MRSFVCVLLLGLVAISFAADKPAAPKPGTEARPLVVKIVPEQHEGPTADERVADETKNLVSATWVLAIFTAALFMVTVWVAKQGKDAAADSLQVARTSADAAMVGAEAARDQAEAARKSANAAVDVALPYLFPEFKRAEFLSYIRAGTVCPTLLYSFKNYGNTPAIYRRHISELRFYSQRPMIPDFDPKKLSSKMREWIISEEDRPEFSVKLSEELPERFTDLLSEMSDPKGRRIYFLGRVEYDDFFGNRHARTFCIKLFPDEDKLKILMSGGLKMNHRSYAQIPPDEADES